MRAAGGAADVLGMQWLRSVTFWPLGETIDSSYWPLGIELAFYLLVAWRLRDGADPDRIERVAWWIGGASAAFWLALALTVQVGGDWLRERLPQLLLLTHGAFFALGMLIQSGHRAGFTRVRVAGIAVFALVAGIEIVAHATDNFATLGVPRNLASPLIAFGLGLGVILLCRRIQPLVACWGGAATVLGLMTYPLYLLHQNIGAVIVGVLGRRAVPAEAGFAAALAVSLGLSWAIVRYAEPGLRPFVGRLFSARRGPRPDNRPSASPSAG